jgi:HK97 family phage prohead protease
MEFANQNFNIHIPLKKSPFDDDYLVGIASTVSMDRDMERMSEKALYDMQREIITNGVNLFGNHEHSWENTLGVVKDAKIENNQLKVGIKLDNPDTNPKVIQMLEKLKRGINLGLSVGGFVTKEKYEFDKANNRKIKVIDGVQLYEISVVGVPSNSDTLLTIPAAIAKSAKEYHCPCCYSAITKNKCDLCMWRR